MLIYTSNAAGTALDEIRRLGMGVMMVTNGTGKHLPSPTYKGLPLALDNGAYQCHVRGFPFQGDAFRRAIAEAFKSSLTLNFIVAPDIVGGGMDSLRLSLQWAGGELCGGRLALAVQDGMRPCDISADVTGRFCTIFVGGSMSWKLTTG
ncbi:MAG: hypothetical protein GY844_26145, partial [Bradyrhizobium sp.]|nr:hypothetical protein [Bradyrhizobium sp.]